MTTWHKVVGHLASHVAGCMEAALLAGCMRKTWGDESPPTDNENGKGRPKRKKWGSVGGRIKGREGRKGRKEKKNQRREEVVESKGGKARTGEEKKKREERRRKEKGKKEERKGGGEPEPTSRREQNRMAKDLKLRYER